MAMTDTAPPAAATSRVPHLTLGRGRAAVTGIFWTTLNTVMATGTTALVFLVTSQYLAPVDFGIVALAASIVAMIGCATPAAFGEALVQRAEITDAHLDTVFWACLGVGLLLYAVLALGAGQIALWAGEPLLAALLPVIGLRLVFEMLATVPNALIQRSMRFKYVALRTAIANTAGGIACMALVFTGHGFWALAVSLVLTPLVALVVVYPAAKWRPGLAVRRTALRDLWSYGIFASGSRLLNNMSLDQLLIGVLGGPVMLGFYFFAKRLYQLVSDVTVGVFLPVCHVLLSSLQTEPAKRREAFLTATYAASMVAFPAFIGLYMVAASAVPLVFGPHWTGAVPAVQALCGLGLMAAIGIVQAALINSQGKAHWWFWYQAAVHLSTVPLILLFHAQGLAVMMLALLLRTVLLWPISIRMTLRMLDLRLLDYGRSFLAPMAAALVMAGLIGLIPAELAGQSATTILAIQIVAGIAIYGPLATIFSLPRARRLIRLLLSRKAKTS